MIQAGTVGLLGLSLGEVGRLRAATDLARPAAHSLKSVLYIFLSGGLAQHESFDMKPEAPENIRGEFRPIATRTPGLDICEHLPRLAARSDKWALVRSLSHRSNDHSEGHHIMLTGRTDLPTGFSPIKPQSTDFPSLVALGGAMRRNTSGLPGGMILPHPLIHRTGRVIPGQSAGQMGPAREPWLVKAAADCTGYGACPHCFSHLREPHAHKLQPVFEAPNLRLPEGMSQARLTDRGRLLSLVDHQRRELETLATTARLDRHRTSALAMLTSGPVRSAFDLGTEDPRLADAYGRNQFGSSLLLARRLLEAGVGMIQVNLGNNETWDTHGNAFPHLKDHLLPPMDQSVSALLDDLEARGMLESTLIVMAGEFGRTPKVTKIPQYALPGRDHWGAVQTVFVAGGGTRGGNVVGSSDRTGGYPQSAPQHPENLAATIYQALGIPLNAHWTDVAGRPIPLYQGEPIPGLT